MQVLGCASNAFALSFPVLCHSFSFSAKPGQPLFCSGSPSSQQMHLFLRWEKGEAVGTYSLNCFLPDTKGSSLMAPSPPSQEQVSYFPPPGFDLSPSRGNHLGFSSSYHSLVPLYFSFFFFFSFSLSVCKLVSVTEKISSKPKFLSFILRVTYSLRSLLIRGF